MIRRSLRIAVFAIVLVTLAGVPPVGSQQLGTIDFPTSGNVDAQKHFVTGVLFLHSFEYGDAAQAFREAQRLDPDFAMAYWGEVMTYNHPVWFEQDHAAGRAVLRRLGPTPEARRTKAPTPREQGYLDAVEILFGEGDKASRDTAYAEAMQHLAQAYPQDHEARAFYALSLLGTSHGGRDIPTYLKAAAVVEEVARENPDHPGAVHYSIHSYDDPIHAPLGLRAARAYSKIAPAAAHAQHMTSHIFLAIGLWDDVVAANEVAAAQTDWRSGHYVSWLQYGYLQQGRYEDARKMLQLIRELAEQSGARSYRDYLARMQAAFLIGTRLWNDPVAQLAIDATEVGVAATAYDFARALSALGRDSPAAAERILDEMAARHRGIRDRAGSGDGDGYVPGLQAAEIMETELRALLRYARGNVEETMGLLSEATRLEDDMPYEFGPPDVVQPSHELFGEILLELNRPHEAQREFERALHLAPRRVRALLGLARAATASGDPKTAVRAYTDVRDIWHRADPSLPELKEVSRYSSP